MSDNNTYTPLRTHLQTYAAGDDITNLITTDPEENNNAPARMHLDTYTMGEEESRLSSIAKTFGLTGRRQPRKPVRLLQTLERGGFLVAEHVNAIMHDATFENAMVGLSSEHYQEDEESHALISLTEEDEDDLSVFDDTVTIRKLSYDASTKGEPSGGYGGSLAPVVLGTIKGLAGATILYFAYGFSLSGYAFALPCLCMITTMYLYSSDKLLQCWRAEIEKMKNHAIDELLPPPVKVGGYGSTCEVSPLNHERKHPKASFKDTRRSVSIRQKQSPLSYPELAHRAFGPNGERLVRFGIASMQLGHMLTYFIFVSQNLHHSMKHLFKLDVPFWVFVLIMACVEIPLTWIRNIKRLTLTNMISLSLILFGLTSCLAYALFGTNIDGYDVKDTILGRLNHLPPLKNRWYLFVGTCVFLFQGSISLCVPFQEAVAGQKNEQHFPKVYKITISCFMVFLSLFSIICWSAFGPSVNIVLTNSLPEGIFPNVVRFAYSVAIMFSFPLIGFPALEIICYTVSTKLSFFQRSCITTITVILVSIIAIFQMNNLGHVVSLIGSLLGCPIVFVLPPLIHNKLVVSDCKVESSKQHLMNYVVAVVGVLIMIFASFITLYTWSSQDAAV